MLSILFFRMLNSILYVWKEFRSISNTNEAVSYISHYWHPKRDNYEEHMWVIVLGENDGIMGVSKLFFGNRTSITASTLDFGKFLMRYEGSEVIILHNHPSNLCYPSNDDIQATRCFAKVCSSIGMKLRDHIILTSNSYYSFLEHNISYS